MNTKNTSAASSAISTDYYCIFYIYLLIALTFLFSNRIAHWQNHALLLLILGSIFTVFSWATRRIGQDFISFSLRVISIMVLFSYLFQAVGPMQQIVHDRWYDEMLISWEKSITGTETSLLLQHITTPVLTEWMMFAYVIYVPLLPLVAFFCYAESGRSAGENYLLCLSIVNSLCYLGFILLPVKTQMFHMPELYSTPLEGSIFTLAGEWMRATQHYPGGALPSPHTAASTVMLIYICRYARRYKYFILPIVLTIYIATIYGRYHYAWDSILGIATGLLTVRIIPYLTNFLEKKNFFPTRIGSHSIAGHKL